MTHQETILNEFLDYITTEGFAPATSIDIIPDDHPRDFQLAKDRKNKKKGYYRLCIDGDFGFGYVGDWRTGECITWTRSTPIQYTKEQREEFNKKRNQYKQEQIEKIKKHQEFKAKEAQDFTLFLSDCPEDHPYLLKKKIKPYNIFLSGNNIIIPMRDDEKVWNYQTIDMEGNKKFLTGARKKGCWFEIEGDETIALCEGYSTGASIHEATGCTIIVCFDASNLVEVARKIKELHPNKEKIICADNDHELIDRHGKKKNIGRLKAQEASEILHCEYKWPSFANPKDMTDFNDLHIDEGLKVVKNQIIDIIKEASEAPSAASGDDKEILQLASHLEQSKKDIDNSWIHELERGKNGLNKRSIKNVLLLLRNQPDLKGLFRYDSFSKNIIVSRPPPWDDDARFKVRPLADYDYIDLQAFMEDLDMLPSRNSCAAAIERTANLPENTFNPASEYFKSLEWDGVPRIDDWLIDFVADNNQPKEYLKLVGRKFLCGMAARAMRAGTKFDTMIILEGEQYCGKSYLSRLLATINGTEYFLDDVKDIENKDCVMKMQGKLVIEFAEISTMRRAEVNDLKAFLTRTHDVYRPPYGRNTQESGRQCVFIGTVNPEGGYLRDMTGNRRYWPISCRRRLPLDDIKEVIPQLHAESAYYVKRGERLYLTEEEYSLAMGQQAERVQQDMWTDRIVAIINNRSKIRQDEILSELGIPVKDRNPQTYGRINGIMTSLDYHQKRWTECGKKVTGFIRNGGQKEKEEEIQW